MSPRLLQVRAGEQGLRLSVRLGPEKGGARLWATVTKEEYLAAGAPAEGALLDGETLRALFADELRRAALRSSCSLLAVAPQSRRALYRKLTRKGYPADAAAEAVRAVELRGYLNEREQLARYCELGLAKGMSRRRLAERLLRRGYTGEGIRAALAEANYPSDSAADE